MKPQPFSRSATRIRSVWWCAPLAFGLAFAGCSGGSSGGGGGVAGSTASGVTTSTTSGAAPASNPIPQAPASVGVPLDTMNTEIQTLWNELRPTLVQPAIADLLSKQLQGKKYQSGSLEVELRNVRLGQTTDMNTAPGFLRLDTQQIQVRAPVQGRWKIVLEADVRVQLSVGSLQPAIDLPLTIAIEDLWLGVDADLDDSDPTRPVLARVGQPQLDFTARFDSTNSLVQQLTGVLNQPVNWIAQQAVTIGLNAIMPQLSSVQGIPGPIPGEGALPLVDSGTNTPFEEVVNRVDLKIRQHNQPHGTIVVPAMDTGDNASWLESYRPGGVGNVGTVVGYHRGDDSAIWTGHYLAAEAFRYSVTQDPLALDALGHTLKGIGALLDVNGGTGLLARVAAPESSLVGQNIASRGVFRSAQLHGERWVGLQGNNGISRDQYSGVMFGLSITYELVPALRSECAFRIQQMLDYLIANDWSISEDRVAWNGTTGSRGPTFWVGLNYQKLTFLLIGHRTDPGRYSAALAQAGPLSENAWLGLWTSTFGTDHYYKFNLSHAALYNYFRLETDPSRWQDLRRAYSITERYVGHHRNAHFDLIRSSFDPALSAVLYPSVREAMRQLMDSPHRKVGPPVVDLSGVQWVNLSTYGYNNGSGGSFTVGATTTAFPTEPLDVFLRKPGGHFQWQRDPFTPAVANSGDDKAEKMGVDLVLPYWMGRAQGAF